MATSAISMASAPAVFFNNRISASITSSSSRPPCIPRRIPDHRYVRILDTTLRDGEQSPGVSFSVMEKLDIARQLALLRVDIIEVGYPFASPNELQAATLIAKEVGNPKPNPNANVPTLPQATATEAVVEEEEDDDDEEEEGGRVPVICAFARCRKADIDAAWEAVKHAAKPCILTCISTSDIHLEHKLHMSRDDAIRVAVEMVSYIKGLGCNDIYFAAEDAGRSDPRMLYRIFEEVIKAGATSIGVGDTVGSLLPHEFGQMISNIKANTPGAQNAIISAHCHNDLGLATANSLAAIAAGAKQVDVSINGIGERAGNAALEEVVMAIKSRGQDGMGGIYTGIETKHIMATSKMVADYSGMKVQRHKAIVGENAFVHESGIHQDGMLKYKKTYEFLSSEEIGLHRTNLGIVLGKHSGRHALKTTLMQLGHNVEGEDLDRLFKDFKAMADNKKHISHAELETLVTNQKRDLIS